jgi:hypothetical protein
MHIQKVLNDEFVYNPNACSYITDDIVNFDSCEATTSLQDYITFKFSIDIENDLTTTCDVCNTYNYINIRGKTRSVHLACLEVISDVSSGNYISHIKLRTGNIIKEYPIFRYNKPFNYNYKYYLPNMLMLVEWKLHYIRLDVLGLFNNSLESFYPFIAKIKKHQINIDTCSLCPMSSDTYYDFTAALKTIPDYDYDSEYCLCELCAGRLFSFKDKIIHKYLILRELLLVDVSNIIIMNIMNFYKNLINIYSDDWLLS